MCTAAVLDYYDLQVEPFLSYNVTSDHNDTLHISTLFHGLHAPALHDNMMTPYDNSYDHNMTSLTESRIYIPYALISSLGILIGLLFLLFYCLPSEMSRGQIARVKTKTTANQLFNPGMASTIRFREYGII